MNDKGNNPARCICGGKGFGTRGTGKDQQYRICEACWYGYTDEHRAVISAEINKLRKREWERLFPSGRMA